MGFVTNGRLNKLVGLSLLLSSRFVTNFFSIMNTFRILNVLEICLCHIDVEYMV